jgi:hypothetical protein
VKNLPYYLKNFIYHNLPSAYFKSNYRRLRRFENEADQTELQTRLNYYCKLDKNFKIPSTATAVKDFKRSSGTGYYFDLKEFLHYFKGSTKFNYHFGDETHVNPVPTLFKARPIQGDNANSILFKLNKRRHFQWVDDKLKFSEKNNQLVWRGTAHHELRKRFAEAYYKHPRFNVGQTNQRSGRGKPWQKEAMTIDEQLNYKFLFCPEGRDVATNLKWAMSSNSLCLMPKPRFETWFMEGTLKAGIHYVEIKRDFSDLEEKMDFYIAKPKEAEGIIANAHKHVARFQNKDLEDLLCLNVLTRFAELSEQKNSLKFDY